MLLPPLPIAKDTWSGLRNTLTRPSSSTISIDVIFAGDRALESKVGYWL